MRAMARHSHALPVTQVQYVVDQDVGIYLDWQPTNLFEDCFYFFDQLLELKHNSYAPDNPYGFPRLYNAHYLAAL